MEDLDPFLLCILIQLYMYYKWIYGGETRYFVHAWCTKEMGAANRENAALQTSDTHDDFVI